MIDRQKYSTVCLASFVRKLDSLSSRRSLLSETLNIPAYQSCQSSDTAFVWKLQHFALFFFCRRKVKYLSTNGCAWLLETVRETSSLETSSFGVYSNQSPRILALDLSRWVFSSPLTCISLIFDSQCCSVTRPGSHWQN